MHQELSSSDFSFTRDARAYVPIKLADAPALIRSWIDLPKAKQRAQCSAVATALRICSTPREADAAGTTSATSVPMLSCADLNHRLFRRPPAAYGLTNGSFSNMVMELRRTLRRLGAHEGRYGGAGTLPLAWKALHDALPTTHRQIALSSFFHYCSLAGLEPTDVNTDTLAAFETWRHERTLRDGGGDKAKTAASNWNWASCAISTWPKSTMQRPSMRQDYTLPLTAYPASLQADLEGFLAGLAGGALDGFFPDDAATAVSSKRRGSLRPRTITTRRYQLRQALSALVLTGDAPEAITSLRCLVDPPAQARRVITFFLHRAGDRRTTQTGGIAEVLRQVAKHHCQLNPAQLAQITQWARKAAPDQQTQMSEKNERRLRTWLAPYNKARLLHFPAQLMRQAADEPNIRAGALRALYAAVLELVEAFPMRRGNLADRRLDRHLHRLDGPQGRITHIELSKEDMKNGQPMLWPIGEVTARLLDTYIKVYRPRLVTVEGNPYLFPNTKDGFRAAHELAVGLKTLVERELGPEFNLHLMRSFAVGRHLRRHPGHYETGRRMLGHKSVKTTTDFYAGLEIDAAAQAHDAGLVQDRKETRLQAQAGFKPPKKRTSPEPRGGVQ